MNRDSCSMKKVSNEAAVRVGKPGAFAIESVTEGEGKYRRMWVHLPGGFVGAFNLEPAPESLPFVWPWNGSVTKPTISKPVRLPGRWSGQIKNGRMVSDPAVEAPSASVAQLPPPLPNAVRAAVKRASRASK